MELMTLNSVSGSSTRFEPTRLIENYDSLLWSERYWASGDFELVSSDIKSAINLLPLESYVAIRESTVPMIVESHLIHKPKNKHARVTIKGRSFESVLERRAAVNSLAASGTPPRLPWNLNADKVSDAAYKAIRVVLGDIARSNLPLATPAVAPEDAIPELNLVLPTDYTTGTPNAYAIEPGDLLSVVLKLLEVNHHGIRAVRPNPGKTTVDLEIYNGADLRSTVVFDARFDQFDDAKYLLSYQGSTNVAYMYGNNGATIKNKNTGANPTGLARRVLLLDEMQDTTLNSDAIRQSRALVELYKNNATAIFDSEISYQVAQRFNKPVNQGGYGLGDIILLQGEYGTLNRIVRVAEFIRSSDASGETAYPAFQAVDE